MTTEDRLTTIANNVPLVYNAGYNKGKSEGGEDVYQYATRCESTFNGANFPENYNFKAKINASLTATSGINTMFYNAKNLKSIKLINEGDKSYAIKGDSAFRNVPTLETVDLTEFNRKFTSVSWMFLSSSKVKSVYGALDFSECIAATIWLSGATALVDMEFVPNTINITISFEWCPNLSADTIQSIIDGLATVTEAKTITFNEEITLTAAQIAEIEGKGWDLVQ